MRSAYLSDLSSSTGHRKSTDAHELDLPAMPDVKGEFLKLCDDLGVGPRAERH